MASPAALACSATLLICRTVAPAGQTNRRVQVFSDDADHSYLSDPVYPALKAELLTWVERSLKPSAATVALRDPAMAVRFGPGCQLLSAYQPGDLESRVASRQRP